MTDRAQLAAETLRLINGEDADLTAKTRIACVKTRVLTETDCAKLDRKRARQSTEREEEWYELAHATEDEQARCSYTCTCERPTTPDNCDYEVTQETTLEATRRLFREDCNQKIGALNFASARHPGGGFLGGAAAQEESLARSSGLYPCLAQDSCKPFYSGEALWYSHSVIVSPDVPVFRDDEGTLLDEPYAVTFVSSAAPNVRAMKGKQITQHNLGDVLEKRIACFLSAAIASGVDTLVLGAWGCGVFGNDPVEVAQAFETCLGCWYGKYFKRMVFAIPDDPKSSLAWPFYQEFS